MTAAQALQRVRVGVDAAAVDDAALSKYHTKDALEVPYRLIATPGSGPSPYCRRIFAPAR